MDPFPLLDNGRSSELYCVYRRYGEQEETMDLAGIREALRHQPFEPFALRLADGRSLDVRHPETVAVGGRRMIVVGPDDSWSVIEPLMVVSLDYNGTSTPPPSPERDN
jgi:hypothetical protein